MKNINLKILRCCYPKSKNQLNGTAPKYLFLPVILFFTLSLLNGCTLLDKVILLSTVRLADAQYKSFLREEDPILAQEAAAGNVKLIDGLLYQDPENARLQLLAAQAFFSYAFEYIDIEKEEERASRFFLRGLKAGASALGGLDAFFKMNLADFNRQCQKEGGQKLEYYFWSALNFASWINLNKSQADALTNFPKIEAAGKTIIQSNENYYYGGGHLLLGLYYASQPVPLGGKPHLAKIHFERCLELNSRKFLTAVYFYARYYAVAVQDRALFRSLLQEIIDFDEASFIEQRLSNLLAKEKARKLLEKEEDLFL